MSRRLARVAVVLAAAMATSAHVGSPDTYFEGAAGPYAIRVIVRNPGVVPGLAQISVRLLTPQAVTRVLVLPVFWDDNYVSLLPGESRELTARYLPGKRIAHPIVIIDGWNIEPLALRPSNRRVQQ